MAKRKAPAKKKKAAPKPSGGNFLSPAAKQYVQSHGQKITSGNKAVQSPQDIARKIAAKKKYGFTPWAPSQYDPALDSQQRAAGRGLGDLQADAERTGQRNLSDYQLAVTGAEQNRSRGLADILRQRQQLQRNYDQLGNEQNQAARVAGVARGGALAQALQKRTANQQWDTQPIDTAQTRLNEDVNNQIGQLSTQYQRGVEDTTTDVTRAQRENTFFGTDIAAQKAYQAKSVGDVMPSNEFSKYGVSYQVKGLKKPVSQRLYTTPSGRRYNRAQFVNLLKKKKRGFL